MSQILVMPSLSDETILFPYTTIMIVKQGRLQQERTYLEIKLCTIHSVIVSVEGLNASSCADVPQAYGLITRTRNELLAHWLELDRVHWVDVPSKSETWLLHVHVPKFYGVVHRAREQEIASIMIGYLPNGLTMFRECKSAASIYKVPNLDGTIAWCCGK